MGSEGRYPAMKPAWLFLVATLLLAPLWPVAHAAGPDLTPSPGSALRQAVLDGVRREVRRLHELDVVFVVRHLKVKDGWAWVHVLPQSRDGAQRYEDVSALLRLRDEVWAVVEMACAEVGEPDCIDSPRFFVRLRARFPDVPVEILEAD